MLHCSETNRVPAANGAGVQQGCQNGHCKNAKKSCGFLFPGEHLECPQGVNNAGRTEWNLTDFEGKIPLGDNNNASLRFRKAQGVTEKQWVGSVAGVSQGPLEYLFRASPQGGRTLGLLGPERQSPQWLWECRLLNQTNQTRALHIVWTVFNGTGGGAVHWQGTARQHAGLTPPRGAPVSKKPHAVKIFKMLTVDHAFPDPTLVLKSSSAFW